MLMLIIIVWLAWSFHRPWYGGLFRPFGGWYRYPPTGRDAHDPWMGGFGGGWHRPPTGGFGGGWHRPPMGGFGGGRTFGGGGRTVGGGAGRGRR